MMMIPAGATGTLISCPDDGGSEHADDEFTVHYQGVDITCRRVDIDLAAESPGSDPETG
jgi:hypothetical protein